MAGRSSPSLLTLLRRLSAHDRYTSQSKNHAVIWKDTPIRFLSSRKHQKSGNFTETLSNLIPPSSATLTVTWRSGQLREPRTNLCYIFRAFHGKPRRFNHRSRIKSYPVGLPESSSSTSCSMSSGHDSRFENDKHSKLYAQYRPTYTGDMYSALFDYCEKDPKFTFNKALDIGCGSGQSTRPLKPKFNQVIGQDVSPTQITQAKKSESEDIAFSVGHAEDLSTFGESTLDLITCAQCFHWFEFDKVFAEVKKALKPNGVLAIYGYGRIVLDKPAATAVVHEFWLVTLKKYWPGARDYVEKRFQGVELPFDDFQRIDDLLIERTMPLSSFIGYLTSSSAYQQLLRDDPESKVIPDLKEKQFFTMCGTSKKVERGDIQWGNWIILILTGLAESGLSGLVISTTIFYQFLLVKFGKSASDSALTLSISSLLRQISGPFAGCLINHYGCRNVAVASGFMLSVSFILTALAPYLWVVYLSFGIIQGIGYMWFTVARQTAVQRSFDESRARANGVHNSVAWGIGGIYVPVLLSFAHQEFSFFGACLIISGLVLHVLPAGMLFALFTEPQKKAQTSHKEYENGPSDELKCENPTDFEEEEETEESAIGKTLREKGINADGCSSCGLGQRVMDSLGFSLLRNKALALFCFLCTIFIFFQQSTAILLSGMVFEKGFSEAELVLMLSTGSFIQIGVRVVVGVLMDLRSVKPHRMFLYTSLLLFSGVVTIFLPVIPGFIPTLILYVAMGNCVGIGYSQFTTVLVDLVQPKDIASAIGLGYFFFGIGNILGSVIGAAIIDITGTYYTVFYVSGAIMATSSIIYMIIFQLFCRPK